MKSIYDYYSEIIKNKDNWTRKLLKSIDYSSVEELFSIDVARDFVYTILMSEGGAFLNKKELQIPEERIFHTVSSFLFGILLKDKLSFDMRDIPRPTGNYHTSFMYFWTMTCLYHDMAYTLEKNSNIIYKDCLTIHTFIEKHGIKYNMLDETKNKELFEQYYKYRVECGDENKQKKSHKIDHGICCGLLLYDSLMNKYYNHIENKKNIKYDFSEPWKYSSEFPKCALRISETIARHNIWISNDENYNVYEKYGLNGLIKESFAFDRIQYGERENLLLLLGLVDTIEPVKKFYKSNNELLLIDILKDLLFDFDTRNKEIKIYSPKLIDYKVFNKWSCLSDWLNIDVEFIDSTIKFNIVKSKGNRE
ncbi:MAG: hypothetical protein ACI37Z_06825 [Candidatus Gastranaerophilaceae bacterium]